jgi:hypothetical protein
MSDNVFTSTAYYQSIAQEKIAGTHCKACGALHLPPRPICPRCLSSDMEWVEFGGKGVLKAYTVIYIAPTAMIAAGYNRNNPYVAGIVQLDEGPSISAQILGLDAAHPESIVIGAPLTATFVERGEGEAKKKFLAFQA